MTLDEVLRIAAPGQYVARRTWCDAGSIMRLLVTPMVIEELPVTLTQESLNADDWDIYDSNE